MNKYNTHIGIFTQSLLKGGAEKQSVLLAQGLNNKYKVMFIVFYGEKINSELLGQLKCDNIKVILLNGSFIKKVISIYRLLRDQEIHIIFNYLLLPNIVGGIIGKLAGVPLNIGGIRNSRIENKKLFLYKICANYINDFTIINSRSGYKYFIKNGGDPRKVCVVYNSIGYEKNKNIAKKHEGRLNILSVGRFEKQKDYYTALKAIEILNKSGVDFIYWIIGWGNEREQVIKYVRMLELESVVRIVVDPKSIGSYYLKADLFLQTSLFEGMSNSIMEAMSFKLPIVATGVGDNNVLLVKLQRKFICQPRDYIQLSKCLIELCHSNETREVLGEYNFHHIWNNFSQDRYISKYDNIIINKINNK